MRTRNFLLIGILLFGFSCEKNNETAPVEGAANQFLCYEFNSEIFVNSFAADDELYAIKVTSDGSSLSFAKVYLQEYLLEIGENIPVPGDIRLLDSKGNLTDLSEDVVKSHRFQFWKGNFDFTLIPWSKIELIAKYSDKLYFTGSQSTPGGSVHARDQSNTTESYFSIKLEGDFVNSPEKDAVDIPLPMTSLEHCPPYWRY